jgi:hypothetical protein
MKLNKQENQFIYFLQKELAVSTPAISLALRHYQRELTPLSMILWQYGLVSLRQLEQIMTWMENSIE